MTLTTVVGSSGSGKTTFLNDVYENHKCIYIRQYHSMRPYIPVSKIPNFDPTRLPFWDIYVKEGKADNIKVGGTMAGEFTAGFSGGQRKLLLFELIYQRTADRSELLIALDEPFAGVTDDFVPFIVDRLNELRKTHNVVLVTNDHVDTLTTLADNTITVSALDRTMVNINDTENVDRQRAIFALSIGDEFKFKTSGDDLRFFLDVEFLSNQALVGIFAYSLICFALFFVTFWNSEEDQAALIFIAGDIIAFFCVHPYLCSLVDWRDSMEAESEALMHSSKNMNRSLQTLLVSFIVLLMSIAEFGVINGVCSGLSSWKFWAGIFFDSVSITFPMICLSIYTKMTFQSVQIFGDLPFLLMVFFSTSFSPGAGLPVIKELRYLFPRFYFWCMTPGVHEDMEGCPDEELNMVCMILSSLLGLVIFIAVLAFKSFQNKVDTMAKMNLRESMIDEEFAALQISLYGEKALKRFQHLSSSMHFRDPKRATCSEDFTDV